MVSKSRIREAQWKTAISVSEGLLEIEDLEVTTEGLVHSTQLMQLNSTENYGRMCLTPLSVRIIIILS